MHERVADNVKRLRVALERLESRRDILRAPDRQWDDLKAERTRCRLNLVHLPHAAGIVGIGHDGQPTQSWENLAQEFEALGSEITSQV